MPHPERRKESIEKYLTNNKEKRSETSKNYYIRNRTKIRNRASKWVKANRGVHDAACALYRARKFNATPKWANKFFIEEIYDLARRRTLLKSGGHAKWHVDHIVPLKSDLVCGLHIEHNLQVIPSEINFRKQNKYWPEMP